MGASPSSVAASNTALAPYCQGGLDLGISLTLGESSIAIRCLARQRDAHRFTNGLSTRPLPPDFRKAAQAVRIHRF